MPKISVLLPTYRRPVMIRRTLASIWAQTFQDYELIIVENGGDDEMRKRYEAIRPMLERGLLDSTVQWIVRNDFASLPKALNVAFEASSGEYISIMEDDDEWEPEFLGLLSNHLDHCTCGMVYAKQKELDEGRSRVVAGNPIPKRFDRQQLLKSNWMGFPMCMYRREAIEAIGGFDEKAEAATDWYTHCYVSAFYDIHCFDKELVIHNWHRQDEVPNFCLVADQLESTLRQRRLWAEGKFDPR